MRNLTTGFKAGIVGAAVRIGLICEIAYLDTPIQAWTGTGDLDWDGKTWLGVGALGGISPIQERTGTESNNLTLTLSGVPSEMRSIALANASTGRDVRVWIAAFDADWNVVPDPWQPFAGTTDVHKIFNGSIELTVETILARLRNPRVVRCTDAEQQRHFPGDKGFEFAAQVSSQPIYWGVATPIAAPAPVNDGGDGTTFNRE